ncbi:MAG: hypothetical protein KC420_01965 [Myxococcales bacterium]|nr:hypothetical protein [Myxococcales bacterium]
MDLLELGSRIPPLAIALAFMIPIAIAVYWYGNRRFGSQLGSSLHRHDRFGGGDGPVDREFQGQVRRFQERDRPARIADAPAGMVMLRGTLCGADQTLGGAPGRECVWRNRAEGRRDMAVGAEIAFLSDGSGQAAIEGLERAQVIAPAERGGRHLEWCSLYLGDEIEVIGRFVPDEEAAEGDDPAARVYGSVGQDGKLHVRLCRRPPPPKGDDADADAKADPPKLPSKAPEPPRPADEDEPSSTSTSTIGE